MLGAQGLPLSGLGEEGVLVLVLVVLIVIHDVRASGGAGVGAVGGSFSDMMGSS